MLMGHDLGTEASYYKPSERELAEAWRKYENALRLDVEEMMPPAKIREELESMRQLMTTFSRLLIEGMILKDPQSAKIYLKRHPELLKTYLEESFGHLFREYSRKHGKTMEELLNEQMARLMDDKNLESFIRGLIRARSSP
jgi:hypothetical protein